MSIPEIRQTLRSLGNAEKAKVLQRFFKTGPGEYGEGDVFLGITVPVLRKLAKEHEGLDEKGILSLLQSEIHEERLLSLLILIRKYGRAREEERKKIHDIYLSSTRYINNWDLVDLSAEHIVGHFLMKKSRQPLYKLARSKRLWDRRIAIMATFHFIKQHEYEETFKIARLLIADEEDLIHKAVGWMLRETGKRHMGAEEEFLKKHYKKMPRTMLRYAIERFPEEKRKRYLRGEI
jgi:3-methyladenine DNA glycosylase AlkD